MLGKKNFALIVHGNSFPAEKGKNTGFGTPNSNAGKGLIDFASDLFTAIQLGPAGKTKAVDSSPYTGTIFSTNPLFIDLEALTEKEWKNILSKATYEKICNENPNKDTNKTAYSYIFNAQNEALKEAYENFLKLDDKKLKKEFEKYKKENEAWLEKDFSYDITGGIDFMQNIADQVGEYWDGVDQDTIIAILDGVFSMTGTKNKEFVDAHTYDVTEKVENKRIEA